MITLEVEDYCQNCPEFEPCIIEEHGMEDFYFEEKIERVVGCGHWARCYEMYKRIKEELGK